MHWRLKMPKLDWVTNLEVGFHLREDTELSPEGGAHQAAGRKGSSLEMPRLPSQVLPMEAPRVTSCASPEGPCQPLAP